MKRRATGRGKRTASCETQAGRQDHRNCNPDSVDIARQHYANNRADSRAQNPRWNALRQISPGRQNTLETLEH
eukprot:11711868-Alexandrium_andersonii.AAC.1